MNSTLYKRWSALGVVSLCALASASFLPGCTPGDGGLFDHLNNPGNPNPSPIVFPAPPQPVTLPTGSSQIAFVSLRDGNREIYIMNADGSQQTRLTFSPSDESAPSISPDGRSIAFTSNIIGNEEIWVMNVDGTNHQRMTANPGRDFRATWHPNSSILTFVSERTGNGEIFTKELTANFARNLTEDPTIDTDPVFDPSGQLIAYASASGADHNLTGFLGLYTMTSAMGLQKRAIAGAGTAGQVVAGQGTATQQGQVQHIRSPNWSPNGQRIAFEAGLGPAGNAAAVTSADLYVIGADAAANSLIRLTSDPANENDPAFSPDSTRVTFRANRNGNSDIYTTSATAATSPAQWVRLTTHSASDEDPWWGVAVQPPVQIPTTICMADNEDNLSFNTNTGDYTLCCSGTTFTGRGSVTRDANGVALQHNTADRRLTATVNLRSNSASASFQTPVGTTRCIITDTSIGDSSCTACSGGGCSGQTQSRILQPIATRTSTVRQNSDNTTTPFPGFLEAGDHDIDNHKTVQGFLGFQLSGAGLPTDPNKICSVRLVLTQNPAESAGQAFFQLGTLFVERIAVSQYGTLNLSAPVTNNPASARPVTLQSGATYTADVTELFKAVVSSGQSEAALRLRFQTLENNDGDNDLVDFFTSGTSQPRLEVSFTP